MPGRFRHYQHVIRMLGLFVGALATFIVTRQALVPSDFGVYGFYRAGALDDVRARPLGYAGEAACLDCHSDIGDLRQPQRHANVRCEACHGPLAVHADGNFDVKPRALNPRLLCLGCHTAGPGRPEKFPSIVPADHGATGPCSECHAPHRPRVE